MTTLYTVPRPPTYKHCEIINGCSFNAMFMIAIENYRENHQIFKKCIEKGFDLKQNVELNVHFQVVQNMVY